MRASHPGDGKFGVDVIVYEKILRLDMAVLGGYELGVSGELDRLVIYVDRSGSVCSCNMSLDGVGCLAELHLFDQVAKAQSHLGALVECVELGLMCGVGGVQLSFASPGDRIAPHLDGADLVR